MTETVLEFDNNQHVLELCGAHDRHLAMIEEGFDLRIDHRGNMMFLRGEAPARALGEKAIRSLYARVEGGDALEAGDVDAAIRLSKDADQLDLFKGERLEIRTKKRKVTPRTRGQAAYVRELFEKELVFGVGPAGTGKTYLAVAVGVAMFLERRVDKLILSRPAVEAGERLGFLPGDMKEKIDPYLRPLYDALNDLWAGARVEKLIEEGRLEVAPLAFMRGRTLTNAFIVLDEAQNTTEMQMRMFLTRLGENSRMVITGDPSQIDLPRGVRSGLDEALNILRGVEGVGVCRLGDADVVRHPLVGRIVRAYAASDARS